MREKTEKRQKIQQGCQSSEKPKIFTSGNPGPVRGKKKQKTNGRVDFKDAGHFMDF